MSRVGQVLGGEGPAACDSRRSGLQMDTRFAREQGCSVEDLACPCGGRGDEYLRSYSGCALVLVGNSHADALYCIGSN